MMEKKVSFIIGKKALIKFLSIILVKKTNKQKISRPSDPMLWYAVLGHSGVHEN